MKVKRCISLLLILCMVLILLPPAQAAENSSVALPESIDEFYMNVGVACHRAPGGDDRALEIFPTEYNYPILGMKVVFEFDRSLAGFNAADSEPKDRYDTYTVDTSLDPGICIGTVSGLSEEPITFLEQSLVDLNFGKSTYNQYHPIDIQITELIIYVPLADGTVAEYTPDYPAIIHLPVMEDCSYTVHLGPKQTALLDDCIDWGVVIPNGASLWKLQKDGTLIFEGVTDIPDFTAEDPAPWLQYRDQIKKIVMRDGMRNIGNYAFYSCTNLEEVVFPSRFSDPYEYQYQVRISAFEGCTALKKLSPLPSVDDGKEQIGEELFIASRAFAGTALETFHVPARTHVDNMAFAECNSLKRFTVDPSNPYHYADQWGALLRGDYDYIEIFPKAMQGEYHVPYKQNDIADFFADCRGLTKIVLSKMHSIYSGAFRNCSAQEIYLPVGVLEIAPDAFENVTATIYYDAEDPGWTQDLMQQYGGNLTWVPHTHEYTVQGVEPTCTEAGFASYTCNTCGYYYEVGSDIAIGHEMGEWKVTVVPTCTTDGEEIRYCTRCDHFETQPTLPTGHSWQDTDQEGIHTCTACGLTEGKYRLYIPSHRPEEPTTAWIDGVEYSFKEEMNRLYIPLTHPNGTSMSMFICRNTESEDIHTHYPAIMHTWVIWWNEVLDEYYVHEVHQFFYYSLLQYRGCSIRIKGVKGIRMITGVHETTRKSLTGKGLLDGHTYKLEEYGTLLAWAKDLEGGNPLTLDQPYVKSNYAYKRGVADPIYSKDAQNVNYTNVLVGFNLDQCKDDLAMRPYMILSDETGRRIMIYGGIVYRSIGYIAYQNRNVFQPKTASYNYVWEIIHHVYGDKYDADYKG